MHRTTTLTLAGFALAFAIVLTTVSVAWRISSYSNATTAVHATDPKIGRDFYAAVADTLSGRDPDALRAVVTPDFADHGPPASGAVSIDATIDRLTAFGSTFPDAALVIDGIWPSAAGLVVQASWAAAPSGNVAGLPFTVEGPVSTYEFLEIRRGKVSARWSSRSSWIEATSVAPTVEQPLPAGKVLAALFHVELPPDAELTIRPVLFGVAMVRSGQLEVIAVDADGAPHLAANPNRFDPGRIVTLPTDGDVRLRTASDETTHIYIFRLARAENGFPRPFRLEAGARSTLLWNSGDSFSLAADWHLHLGRLFVPPGSEIRLGETESTALVIAADAGPVRIVPSGGSLSYLGADYRLTVTTGPHAIETGQAVLLATAESARIGPSTDTGGALWFVALGPVGDTFHAGEPQPAGPGFRT